MRVAGWSSCARALCLGILCALISSIGTAAAEDYLKVLETLAGEGPGAAVERWLAASPPGASDVGVETWEAQRRHRVMVYQLADLYAARALRLRGHWPATSWPWWLPTSTASPPA